MDNAKTTKLINLIKIEHFREKKVLKLKLKTQKEYSLTCYYNNKLIYEIQLQLQLQGFPSFTAFLLAVKY